MNRHPFTPPENYEYVRKPFKVGEGEMAREGESVLAVQDGRLLGIANVENYTTPFLPSRLKPILHEARMRRAAFRAARRAEETKKSWNQTWYMGAINDS